uniref:TF-B3 domain-containing protein n=1 Tax=Oryza brachyantha TaxID=4533 RepID=J3LQV7_ORYBR
MAGQGSKMKRSFDCCKRYVDHLNGKMKCFHIQMRANSGHSIIIPNKFLEQFGGKISTTIELKSPKGIVYVVKVLILDSDGCEKAFPRAGTRKTCRAPERNADPIDISGSTHDGTMESSESEECTESSSSEHESSHELDDPQTTLAPILSYGTSLSEAQEEEVAMLIRDIQPEIPVYVAVMKHSNVNSPHASLVIAKLYASTYFPNTSQTITLQRQGKNKKWRPRYYIRKDRPGHILYGRWINFVRDNHIKEGDICIFHAMKFTREEFGATVHLLRARKSHSFGEFCTNPKIVDSKYVGTRPKMTGSSVKEEPYDGQCNKGQGKRQGPQNFDDSRGSSKPYILSHRDSLTDEQVGKVEEVAHSIQPGVPVYVSIMKRSSVGTDGLYTLKLGKQFSTRHLPPQGDHQVLTLLMEGEGHAWRVRMCSRSGDAQTLTTGWREFVRDKHLHLPADEQREQAHHDRPRHSSR